MNAETWQRFVKASLEREIARELAKSASYDHVVGHPYYYSWVETGTKPRTWNRTPTGQFAKVGKQDCPFCGSFILPVSGLCPNCNAPQPRQRPQRKPEIKTAKVGWKCAFSELGIDVAILALLLSCVGSIILIIVQGG